MPFSFREFLKGLRIAPKTSSEADKQGELEVLSTDGKLRYHNGTTVSPVVTESSTATLTNKTIDGDDNTVQDLALSSLKTVLADASKVIQRDGSGAVISGATIGGGGSGSLVTTDGTQTLTNKTIDGDDNTVQDLPITALKTDLGAASTFISRDASGVPISTKAVPTGAVVGTSDTQTLTGKTIDGDDNTVQDLALSSLKTVLADANKVIQRNGSGAVVSGGVIGGTSSGDIVTTTGTQTLTGKTIDGDDNTVQDLDLSSLKTVGGDANKFLQRDGSGVVVASKAVPTGTVVGTTDTQALTNKDIDGGTASNTSRITAPKASKTTLDGLTRKEATIVYGTDTQKLYVDDGSTLKAIGSGLGGINLIGLDSSYLPNDSDSIDAESSIGLWAAYADAAAVAPTDMTGGSPGTTITRTTSTPLDGAASFLMDLGSGSSRQGEGISKLCYIAPGYRGLTLTLTAPFSVTGTLLDGDLRLYAYDVTNSTLITPFTQTSILGSQGILKCLISIPTTCAQLRVGVHVARTSTGSLSVKFDDWSLSPQSQITGAVVSDWVTWTPTGSWNTNVTYTGRYRRVGDTMEGEVYISASGAPNATQLTVNLPSGLTIDTSKLPSSSPSQMALGLAFGYDSGATYFGDLFYNNTTSLICYAHTTASAFSDLTHTNPFTVGSGDSWNLKFRLPISQWSSNVTLGDSSTYSIAAFLANGTRVTGSAPTQLGQYRSYLRNAGAQTYTETNGSPSVTPSVADGIRIWTSGTFASADASNSPSRYDIFVGINKTVRVSFNSSTGRTGVIDTTPYSSTKDIGIRQHYDPTTGILTIVQNVDSNATNNQVGVNPLTGASFTTAYFDVVVSENALSVGSQQPRSMVELSTPSGAGSTNTSIRNFTVTKTSVGSALSASLSGTLGTSVTVNEDGVYYIEYNDMSGGANCTWGLSVDSSELTTAVTSINNANYITSVTVQAANIEMQCVATIPLRAGQVVRPHLGGGTIDGSARGAKTIFRMTKVSN